MLFLQQHAVSDAPRSTGCSRRCSTLSFVYISSFRAIRLSLLLVAHCRGSWREDVPRIVLPLLRGRHILLYALSLHMSADDFHQLFLKLRREFVGHLGALERQRKEEAVLADEVAKARKALQDSTALLHELTKRVAAAEGRKV
eukprot:Sspe_Gene.96305::Locus_68919_Transcript_1_1_Confidence_1.000_Length_527::g.96305::m.96305